MTMRAAPTRSRTGDSDARVSGASPFPIKARAIDAATVTRGVVIVAAAFAAMALIVAALWAWQGAPDMVADWEITRPGQMLWAIRIAAIATAALAQVVIFGVVAGQIFVRRSGDYAVVIASAGVFILAVIAAVVLALGS